MWTGDKVITKTITPQSLEDINDVLRRPCVIWDNEHANDYDQKRVFLGKKVYFSSKHRHYQVTFELHITFFPATSSRSLKFTSITLKLLFLI